MTITNFTIIKGTSEQLAAVKEAITGERIDFTSLLPEGTKVSTDEAVGDLYDKRELEGALYLIYGTYLTPLSLFPLLEQQGYEVVSGATGEWDEVLDEPVFYNDEPGELEPVFKWQPHEEGAQMRVLSQQEFDADLFDDEGDDATYDGQEGSGWWDIQHPSDDD